MRNIIFAFLAFAIVGITVPGCSIGLKEETKEQCAQVGEERLCEIASMKGFVANAIENANDALESGKIDDATNELVYELVVDARDAINAYESGESKIDGVIEIVESLGVKLLQLGLTQ